MSIHRDSDNRLADPSSKAGASANNSTDDTGSLRRYSLNDRPATPAMVLFISLLAS